MIVWNRFEDATLPQLERAMRVSEAGFVAEILENWMEQRDVVPMLTIGEEENIDHFLGYLESLCDADARYMATRQGRRP